MFIFIDCITRISLTFLFSLKLSTCCNIISFFKGKREVKLASFNAKWRNFEFLNFFRELILLFYLFWIYLNLIWRWIGITPMSIFPLSLTSKNDHGLRLRLCGPVEWEAHRWKRAVEVAQFGRSTTNCEYWEVQSEGGFFVFQTDCQISLSPHSVMKFYSCEPKTAQRAHSMKSDTWVQFCAESAMFSSVKGIRAFLKGDFPPGRRGSSPASSWEPASSFFSPASGPPPPQFFLAFPPTDAKVETLKFGKRQTNGFVIHFMGLI